MTPMLSKQEQHQARQQHEHAEAQKRKAERRQIHERRMRIQAEQASRAKAERAWRHQTLKDQEARRSQEKYMRRSSSSVHSSWSEWEFNLEVEDAPARRAQWESDSVARYEAGWERMRRTSVVGAMQLRFRDIPWPGFQTIDSSHELSRSDIEAFVLSKSFGLGKDRRAVLREFILQWHPDKFIGRWLALINETEHNAVKEGVNLVACIANELLGVCGK